MKECLKTPFPYIKYSLDEIIEIASMFYSERFIHSYFTLGIKNPDISS